jgi:hypothetical protein
MAAPSSFSPLKRLIATIIGPSVGFGFWSFSLVLPVETGNGMVVLAGLIRSASLIVGLGAEFMVMGPKAILHSILRKSETDIRPAAARHSPVGNNRAYDRSPRNTRQNVSCDGFEEPPRDDGNTMTKFMDKMTTHVSRKKLPVLFLAAIIAVMLLVPPWIRVEYKYRGKLESRTPHGYAPVFFPPRGYGTDSVILDWQRLGLQLGAVFAVAGAVVFLRRRDKGD